ncbi:hypothetical protein VFPPC_10642 [Pochonia chlamydosporia 170]|uniref:Uncharacterized protein n=1 Tax=Pochonia chlamydosporia 170 TaxID=1380566 RepID=A0A179F4V9_METCM|nr:hypothetical protein VFPPC_10642 [Pochonia chlamydosporia 170]OAQ60213.1 hypothetical protein VFPPC_10642 [Pochonia chlamydosporia 170]
MKDKIAEHDLDSITAVPRILNDEKLILEWLQNEGSDSRLKDTVARTTSFLQYFADTERYIHEKPYASKIPPLVPNQAQLNFGGQYHQVVITDIAGHETLFSLDKDGFQFVPDVYHGPMFIEDLQTYINTMSNWLTTHLDCSEVFVFDFALRHEHSRALGIKGFVDVARRVHCDQTPRSAIGRIKLHMGMRADELLRGRCRLINIWRPLVPVVESYPLAACSFTSVTAQDFVPVDVIFPHYAEEAFEIIASKRHRWYYRSKMTWKDVALLKIYDNNQEDRVAYCAPHTGFRDPRSGSQIPRSSIELRCLVFGDNKQRK